jgi:hypothetical protein
MVDRSLNPATLEKDLRTLMQKSDEVVLVGDSIDQTSALSPSGKRPVLYWDVPVIRSWKGSHRAGDRLTFGLPLGMVNCRELYNVGEIVDKGKWMPESLFDGARVLFLSYDRTRSVDGLRLTGGEGTQGLFQVGFGNDGDESLSGCYGSAPCAKWDHGGQCVERKIQIDEVKKCDAALSKSQAPVSVGNSLPQKYNGMPLSQFLKEMQTLADSSSKPEQDANSH